MTKPIQLLLILASFLISLSVVAKAEASEFNILTNIKKIPPSLGRCHMDSCSWSKPISVHAVQKSSEQAVLEVNLLGGESANENGKIKWSKKPHKITIVCSSQHPSVSINDQTDELALNPDGVAGVFTSGANLYFQYCHSYTGDDAEASKKFGYNIRE